MQSHINGQKIQEYHDSFLANSDWPKKDLIDSSDELFFWIGTNHFYNTSLWDEEDLARRVDVDDSSIAENKREIDFFNQNRNDAIEKIDETILLMLEAIVPEVDAWHNCETAGSIIDRLSISSLKIFNMSIQSNRKDISEEDIAIAKFKADQLKTQRDDLLKSFDNFFEALIDGKAFYKIYRQHKMYNDPKMNPYLSGLKS